MQLCTECRDGRGQPDRFTHREGIGLKEAGGHSTAMGTEGDVVETRQSVEGEDTTAGVT